jgi:hypothetical protein
VGDQTGYVDIAFGVGYVPDAVVAGVACDMLVVGCWSKSLFVN